MKPIKLEKTGKYLIPGSVWRKLVRVDKGLSDEKYNEIYIETDEIKKLKAYGALFINDAFLQLWDVNQGLLFLDGGYGSSKTTYAITRLLVKALQNENFKCYYGRQKKTEARELHDNIVREIERNGWDARFKYSMTPTGTTEILCKENGNIFKMFGCDDVESLKGIDNPTDIFIDEVNQITFDAFSMIATRLRTPGVPLQLTGCFNNCDVFPDHWLVKYIYGSEIPTTKAEEITLEALKRLGITKHHSTYLDNHFINQHNYLESLKMKAKGDEEVIKKYAEGGWGVRLSNKPYYKQFKSSKHIYEDAEYDRDLPLIISIDDNVNPYFPMLIGQIHGNKIFFIDEIAATNPNNTIDWICGEFIRRYPLHDAGLFITGDATAIKHDVKVEYGTNMYTMIASALKRYKPILKLNKSNPNNKDRGAFINMIFKSNYADIDILINKRCEKLIEDMVHCQDSPRGDGSKDKKTSMVGGVRSVQRYGHFGDCMDYFVCMMFSNEFAKFQNGEVIYEAVSGKRSVRNAYSEKKKLQDPVFEAKKPDFIEEEIVHKRFSKNRML